MRILSKRASQRFFSGNDSAVKPAAAFEGGQDVEVLLEVRDLQLDPLLVNMQDKLMTDSSEMVVDAFWCNTPISPAGLEIVEVEIASPESPHGH